jgi:hypothetical protein
LSRYRRGKKKEREKQLEREIETLAVTDPQALMDRMEQTETKRIQVRLVSSIVILHKK